VRAVLQRVLRARVTVNGALSGDIGLGLLALIGVGREDTEADAGWMARKVAEIRIFADDKKPMNRSIVEAGGGALVVSQFTLYGETSRGRRPGFTNAAPPEIAEPLVARVASLIAERGIPVATGVFGAHMEVELVNDGPVTILLNSRER
jgi:D-tyrosyl-tRNA(Tyr) deacylase